MREETRTELNGDRQLLGSVIKYHIVPVEQHHCDLHNDLELATLDSSAKKLLIKEYAKVRGAVAQEVRGAVAQEVGSPSRGCDFVP